MVERNDMSPNKTLPKYRDYLRNTDAETKRGHRDHKPLVTPWVNQALFMCRPQTCAFPKVHSEILCIALPTWVMGRPVWKAKGVGEVLVVPYNTPNHSLEPLMEWLSFH